VVDNASTDGSAGLIGQRFPDVGILETASNLGFAGGCNVGIRRALEMGSEFVWLLNNDTQVHPQALVTLVAALQAERTAGLAGSKIYYAADPSRLWFAGGYFTPSGLGRHRGQDQLDHRQFDDPGPVDYITGCSLLIRTEVVRQIGLLREDYFMYWEEVEWSARARRLGWNSIYVPSSVVWHKVGASLAQAESPKAYYYHARNWLDFVGHTAPARLPLALAHVAAASALSMLRGQPAMAAARMRGIADAARGRLGPRP
jgi:GT2 family glycosyltransferase